jgi:hypothetical protein
METPILFLDELVLPGLAPELTLRPEQRDALRAWQRWMGFGTLEVLLAAPADPARPCGPENHLPMATLAEVLLPDDEAALTIAVAESRRVQLGERRLHPKQQAPVATWSSADPTLHGTSPQAVAVLRVALYELLLTSPALMEAINGEPAAPPVVELEEAPPWCAVYVAALALGADAERQRALYLAPDLGEEVAALQRALGARLGAVRDRRRGVAVGAATLLEQGVEVHLQEAAAALEALERLCAMAVIALDGKQARALRGLRKEVERLIPIAQNLIEQIEGEGEEEEA